MTLVYTCAYLYILIDNDFEPGSGCVDRFRKPGSRWDQNTRLRYPDPGANNVVKYAYPTI